MKSGLHYLNRAIDADKSVTKGTPGKRTVIGLVSKVVEHVTLYLMLQNRNLFHSITEARIACVDLCRQPCLVRYFLHFGASVNCVNLLCQYTVYTNSVHEVQRMMDSCASKAVTSPTV